MRQTRIGQRLASAGLVCASAALAVPLDAQVGTAGTDTVPVAADPGDVRGNARSAQADFERARERHMPFTFVSYGGECDEVVGRLCTWYGEGEWQPTPEAEELVELRRALVARLDSLQRLSPGDDWIVGQRVWYRAEAGDWADALAIARHCAAEPWWCAALEGFALHGLERWPEAEDTFERALGLMGGERAREWRLPERVVQRDVRDLLRDLEREDPEALERGLRLLWTLADPLYLVAGNDRLTAHYARWTVATLKDEARNPFRMRWGDDLAELTLRHGWELGWERSPGRALGGPVTVTGHKHPEAREWMPSEAALLAPARVAAEELLADRRRPRSLYAPPYAPVLLPMESTVTVFPRATGSLLFVTAFLPEDTTYHADHDHERPWLEPGDQEGMADRIAVFARPVDGGVPRERRVEGTSQGALLLELDAGGYAISVESWSPERRRAGRLRFGLEARPVPADVAALSDILLLDGEGDPPRTVEEALPVALSRARIRSGQRLVIAWEIAGLGFRAETLQLAVSVERTDRGLFRRVGEFLGLAERPPSLELSWQEPGPEAPGPVFRHLDLALPDLDPGGYEVTLTLRTAGRSDAVSRRSFQVVDP